MAAGSAMSSVSGAGQLRRLVGGLTLRQKLSLVAAAALVGGGLYGLARWNRERDFRPLYTGIAAEDAGQILSRLRESGVAYRVGDNGTTILVPSAQVAETRLQLAAAGLPRSGRIGFELFDQTNFGVTDFAEQVNYHRALEGELERSVMALREVERARVHITLPRDSVFLESRRPAKASVLVQLRPGAELAPPSVQALCHLLASAVEGLEPEAVSVLDMRGRLLNRPRRRGAADLPEPSEAVLAYRQSIEKELLAKIESTLEPVLGLDGFRAGVSVDCDFTSGEQSEEIFDPSKSVMTSAQRTEDVSGAATPGGVPGTASNLPRPTSRPGAGAVGNTRRMENITYQSSRTVRRLRLPQGAVKRISVSLLVDYDARWEGEGENARRVLEPPPPEKIKAIRELTAAAVGLKPDRGDQLIVESLPFETTVNQPPPGSLPPAPAPGGREWAPGLGRLLADRQTLLLAGAGAGVLLLILAIAVGMLLRRRRRRRRQAVTVTAPPELAAAPGKPEALEQAPDVGQTMQQRLAEHAAMKARLDDEALQSLKLPVATKKTEVLVKHISEEAQKNPAAMAQLVRTWLNEEVG